jgi:pimeloyl-ACP methyl ester carboxylesterase
MSLRLHPGRFRPTLLTTFLLAFPFQPASAQTLPSAATRPKPSRTLPVTAFYNTPVPLPAGRPGELIRFEPFYQYQLPPQVDAVRILYHSRSANAEDVAVSAVVLLAHRTPPSGGWPILVWAHAHSGTARPCAPSLMRNVFDGPFLSMYVALGYAVVATDYAGLGTAFASAPLDIRSTASDVASSVAAARAALPQLGPRWVVMGESQGALTAAAVAELENQLRDPNYLASIAISGLADPAEAYRRFAAQHAQTMLMGLAHSIKTVDPQVRLDHMLTASGLSVYRSTEQVCPGASHAPEVPADPLLQRNWESEPAVQKFFLRNRLGDQPAFGPILVIAGEDDALTPVTMTARTVARMCKQKDRIQFNRYSGLDSGSVLGGTIRDQMAWIEDRLAGRAPPSNCP